jgi:recombination protein RecA
VVEKSGSWFSYGGERIGQGRENAKTFLKAHRDVAETIENAIRANAGLIAQRITGTPSEGEEGSAADA